MKTRFKYWCWRDIAVILLGVIVLSMALGWTNSNVRSRAVICDPLIIEGCLR